MKWLLVLFVALTVILSYPTIEEPQNTGPSQIVEDEESIPRVIIYKDKHKPS